MRANRSMPSAGVIPELLVADIHAASRWLSAAFGFEPHLVIGDHRVQMNVGPSGSLVLIGSPTRRPAAVMVRVDEVDAHFARARAAGASILSEPATFPYGERQYTADDPDGHRWTFSQTIDDVDPASWGGQLV